MDTAPKYLNLLKIKLPAPGIVSILHRISGMLMIIGLPVLIGCFGLSLHDAQGFTTVQAWLSSLPARLLFALLGWSLFHHMLAGIRFLLIDVDIGVERPSALKTAYLVNGISLIALLVLLFGAMR